MFRALVLFLLGFVGPLHAESLQTEKLPGGRYYLIAVPGGVENPPLILAMHGGGGNPAQFEGDSGLTALALRNGFAIAYPAGSGRTRLLTWNAIYCCAYAEQQNIDDIGFLDRVVADAAKTYGVDPTRIFATGMSNGSMMAETYAAKRPRIVRAVAGVSGTLNTRDVRLKGAVPLLLIHGTADEMVPYNGGVGAESFVKVDFVAVDDVLAAFRKAAGGNLVLRETVLDPVDDGMTTDRFAWSRNGVDWVVHLRVNGGGHNWPGGARGVRKGATRDFTAAAEVISFFSQFK